MFKKFTDGFIFGSGFAISFITLWYVAAYLIYPMFVNSQIEQFTNKQQSGIESRDQPSISQNPQVFSTPFHELKLDEKIKQSSVIVLAKYEPSSDGKMKAILKEFLKKESGVEIYYDIGDEYPSSSYYPKENTDYGDGVIIFFTGSPAMMRYSTTFHGDRISGLGDLPVELFRTKCRDNNA